MKISVKLFAYYRTGRFSAATKEYPPNTCVRDVLRHLQIPEKDLGIVLINGRFVELEQTLKEGDELSLFPMVGGG
jgi:molybdopterin converting factor small subunit